MAKPGNTGLRRLVFATRYSIQGLREAWRLEAAFRQEIALTLVALPASIWLGRTALERTLLVGCLVLVLVVELLNSAIEAAVDRFGDEINVYAGRAKDLGSAAVMVGLLLAACVWASVAWDRFGGPTITNQAIEPVPSPDDERRLVSGQPLPAE